MESQSQILNSGIKLNTFHHVTIYSIITPLTPLKYHVFENIMENGAFTPKDQKLQFP